MNRALAPAMVIGCALALATPAAAQHDQHGSGMTMPMPAPKKKPVAKPPAPKPPAAKKPPAVPPRKPPVAKPKPVAPHADAHGGHAIHDPAMPAMDMADMDMGGADKGEAAGMNEPTPDMDMPEMDMGDMDSADPAPSGTALPAGNDPAPAPPTDHYAARFFPPAEIAAAHHTMMQENGGGTFYQLMFNLAEYQVRDGHDGYRWDGEAWFGGDIDRLTLKSEGEGRFREGVEAAEIQALYSRAIGPYFNLQAGVRHDFRPSPSRTYATVGFEGLAPYWFEVEGAAFLSDKGDVLGRLEAYYDQRITQRLILQPRVEFNLAAQDVPANRIGAGLTNAELGLRLRYEITREFGPYVGVSYDAKTGQTARYARADGEDPTTTSFVMGVHFWF